MLLLMKYTVDEIPLLDYLLVSLTHRQYISKHYLLSLMLKFIYSKFNNVDGFIDIILGPFEVRLLLKKYCTLIPLFSLIKPY